MASNIIMLPQVQELILPRLPCIRAKTSLLLVNMLAGCSHSANGHPAPAMLMSDSFPGNQPIMPCSLASTYLRHDMVVLQVCPAAGGIALVTFMRPQATHPVH